MPIRMKPDLTDEVRSNGIFFYLNARQRALRTGGQAAWKTRVLPATPAMRPQTFNDACGTTSIDRATNNMFHGCFAVLSQRPVAGQRAQQHVKHRGEENAERRHPDHAR